MWHKQYKHETAGFTIVELLIVVVVIAILASISLVSYTNIQQRARDSQRKHDIQAIIGALELYHLDHGEYPDGSGSTTINSGWSTTADGSWAELATRLKPYLDILPSDPISTPGANMMLNNVTGYNYAYFTNRSSGVSYCGSWQNQMYILVYRLESSETIRSEQGDCTASPLTANSSEVSHRRVAQ